MNVVVILANRRYSWDRHIWDVRLTALQDANIAAFTAKLLFVGAASFTRISLICFYYRLVKNSGITWFNKVLHASMFFVVGLGIAFTCVGIWLCDPVEAYWVFPLIEGHKCMNEGTSTLIIGIFNCIADLLCTLLPIPLVWKLKMPAKHRTGVCILLGLGFIVTIAGIIRTYFIWQSLINSWDETWYSYPLWICAAIEIDLAVVSFQKAPKNYHHRYLTGIIVQVLTTEDKDLCMRTFLETITPSTHLDLYIQSLFQILPRLLRTRISHGISKSHESLPSRIFSFQPRQILQQTLLLFFPLQNALFHPSRTPPLHHHQHHPRQHLGRRRRIRHASTLSSRREDPHK